MVFYGGNLDARKENKIMTKLVPIFFLLIAVAGGGEAWWQ